jgi:hypothetical protein
MSIPPSVVSGRRNFAGLFGCIWFRKIILVVFRFFEFSHSQDHSRPGRAGSKSGHVRYAADCVEKSRKSNEAKNLASESTP